MVLKMYPKGKETIQKYTFQVRKLILKFYDKKLMTIKV